MNNRELSAILEFAEGRASASAFRAVPAEFKAVSVETEVYVARFMPSIDMMLFNRVVGLGLKGPVTSDVIASIVKKYRDEGVKNFALQISPEAQPPELYQWLAKEGLSVRDYWTKVYRGPDPDFTIATDLRVEQIDRVQAEAFGHTAAIAFSMPVSMDPMISATVGEPGWSQYMAWDGSTPAAVAALYIRDDVGWLGFGATVPEYRRRGAQGALMARRIRDASRAGCKWIVTETWQDRPDKRNPSFHNMIRAGFKVAYHRRNYMPERESGS